MFRGPGGGAGTSLRRQGTPRPLPHYPGFCPAETRSLAGAWYAPAPAAAKGLAEKCPLHVLFPTDLRFRKLPPVIASAPLPPLFLMPLGVGGIVSGDAIHPACPYHPPTQQRPFPLPSPPRPQGTLTCPCTPTSKPGNAGLPGPGQRPATTTTHTTPGS